MSSSVLHQILDRSGFSPVTKDKYRAVIDRWIEFAGTKPEGWTRDKAQDFYDQLLSSGVSTRSANTYLASLRYVSRWYATKTGAVDFAIVQKQRGTKGQLRSDKTDEAPILDEDEARALIDTCRGGSALDRRDLAMLVIGLETGMRRISLRGFHFEGLSIQGAVLDRNYPTATVPIKGPGGEETFAVPLSDTAYRAFDWWYAWLREHETSKLKGPVFRRLTPRVSHKQHSFEVGDVVSLTGINEIIEARSQAANIRHVNPHMLRHTFITWRTRAGFTPLEISAITGHKISMMVVGGVQMKLAGMSTYIHQDVEKIRNSTPPWLADLVQDITK